MIQVKYDSREGRSGIPTLIKETFEQHGIEDVDNIVVKVNNQKYDYLIGGLWVERIEAEDFLSKMQNNRLNNQMVEMSIATKYSLALIEGNVEHAALEHGINKNYVLATKAGIVIERSPEGLQGMVTTLQTQNKFDTAEIIYFLWNKIRQGKLLRFPRLTKLKWNNTDRANLVIDGLPNIGPERRKALFKEFKSLKGIINANIKSMTNIMVNKRRLGHKTAENLHKIFNEEID